MALLLLGVPSVFPRRGSWTARSGRGLTFARLRHWLSRTLVRGGAASGNRTPDLLITRRPDPAYYGLYQRQQLQVSHL